LISYLCKVWYTATKDYDIASDTDWVKVIGPYIDTERTGKKVIALSLPLTSNNQLIGKFMNDSVY